jgi:hypothetical protein|tara:strand:+ start:282 stop:833 length:552 start_codon:yes stop_codon:yes gene_type:complete
MTTSTYQDQDNQSLSKFNMHKISALLAFLIIALTLPGLGQDTTTTSDQSTETTPIGQQAEQLTPEEIIVLKQLTPEEIAQQQKEAEEAVEGLCSACGGGIALMIGIFVVAIVLNIALLIWVARDAKSRGMDSSVLWMFLVMGSGIIGLIIYLCSRPQGQLSQCPSCNGKRLTAIAKCPHCQNP